MQTEPHSASTAALSRRTFLTAGLALGGLHAIGASAPNPPPEPVIDIHQHTHYHDRTDDQMLAHQRAMGITTTILLPAGRLQERPSTHSGKSNGLAARCTGNEAVMEYARAHPGEFLFGANEITDLPEAKSEIEKYLKLGAKLIAEQKFGVECDSPESERLYALAADYGVRIEDGALKGLCARSVVVLDEQNKVLYTQLVPEITQEPDYDKALAVLG